MIDGRQIAALIGASVLVIGLLDIWLGEGERATLWLSLGFGIALAVAASAFWNI